MSIIYKSLYLRIFYTFLIANVLLCCSESLLFIRGKIFIILDGCFDNNSNALFGSAFRKIIFDPWLMTVLA